MGNMRSIERPMYTAETLRISLGKVDASDLQTMNVVNRLNSACLSVQLLEWYVSESSWTFLEQV